MKSKGQRSQNYSSGKFCTGGDGATLIIHAGGFLLAKAFPVCRMLYDLHISVQIDAKQKAQMAPGKIITDQSNFSLPFKLCSLLFKYLNTFVQVVTMTQV